MLHNSGDLCYLGMSKTKLCVLLGCFFLSSALVGARSSTTHPDEVSALRTIKRSLIDPNKNLTSWNRGDPCTSNWNGVLCFNTTLDDGYLHVRELELLNMNLSGTLSPALGRLSRLLILDFMWNKISGSIPKEIGNITTLELLVLNGNRLTGSLPDELGYLSKLDRIQIDENNISGPIPKSFANLNKTKHFYMNNNSISGHIPPELSKLPNLKHLLLDNNNLSGYLPQELAQMPNLAILQLDNNNFDGATIPGSFGNIPTLLKLSLRNCSLQGSILDLSRIPNLGYLLLANNSLNGSISSSLWQNKTPNAIESTLTLDLENNLLVNISGSSDLPPNVTLWLKGNAAVCLNGSLVQFCSSQTKNETRICTTANSPTTNCKPQSCPFEYSPTSLLDCFCAEPLLIGYRMQSPSISDFIPYKKKFEEFLTQSLHLSIYQLYIYSCAWQGPRLGMYLKLYPVYGHKFNKSEVQRIRSLFIGLGFDNSNTFGPCELINFTLSDVYKDEFNPSLSVGVSKGALVGIILGTFVGAVTLSTVISLIIFRKRLRAYHVVSKRHRASRALLKIDGVKSFTYGELALATNNFDLTAQIGRGGYGNVYRGTLANGTIVAIKRAHERSLQGEKEFLTEIQLLSRLHHRNLVSLVGYCDEEGEQMLVYEYMSNGTLRDHLLGKVKEPLSFAKRLRIALGSSKGILYLHTEVDPPIFHRDIKTSNILLDSKFVAKVADFGLSRLAPMPDTEGAAPAYVSTVVKGTPGYLDPEYFLTHKLTDKSDVYSLGVVFLELLTGMQPISHGKNLVREVNIAYRSGIIFSVIDGRMGSYPSECVEKFVSLAMKCCQDETNSRPSMTEVVQTLQTIWLMMPEYFGPLPAESMEGDSEKTSSTPASSSSIVNNSYMSSDVSGSDLVSGVIPTITPK
ncbi:hypothetical protein SLEP1_g21064 [Rubroshorea leprosula]|uniref:non-specific serine/threonine protein kinase n=1 Tax=Rubroshorea leprosula TaxID=152421 RepID=A0AAV5JAU1_9ROSI|nr:hypothetical protein SLEP1_g21064 [Rubroshorea leprosula]